MTQANPSRDNSSMSEHTVLKVVNRLESGLGMQVEFRGLDAAETDASSNGDSLHALWSGAEQAGVLLKEVLLDNGVDDVLALMRAHYPVLLVESDGACYVLEKSVGRKIESTRIAEHSETVLLSRRQLRSLLSSSPAPRSFVAKKQLECDSISAAPVHDHHGDHHGPHQHPKPLRRFLGLLNLERNDIWIVILFASVAGILALATPLAVESLVNVVSWGTYLQPLVVLGVMLLTCLGLAGVLQVLQTLVVEMIQRRQFVRIVNDLAHRFPRANQASLVGLYPRELANRMFDIMTIQKATAVLLLDGVAIALATVLGLVLLAFYHPFLLSFNIVLLFWMLTVTWLLGRGGIRSAVDESLSKYRVVHWLQDVIAFPSAFKINGGESLAIQRANQLTTGYINARIVQFSIVIRQIAFAITLQVLASTALLGLGGWLVIQGQLTLGQLVASELVITVVVGAFAKAGKSLEKFYDLMAGIDKVGHLLDIPADPIVETVRPPDGPASVRWDDLSFREEASSSQVAAATLAPGSRVAVVGEDISGRSKLAQALAGLIEPTQGVVDVAGFDVGRSASVGRGRLTAYAGEPDVFHATLRENVDLQRPNIGHDRVREVLAQVGLADDVLKLSDGMQTRLQSGGFPLTRAQCDKLVLARAMAARPKLLVIDGLLDRLNRTDLQMIWQTLSATEAGWTLVIVTNRDDIAELCSTKITVNHVT